MAQDKKTKQHSQEVKKHARAAEKHGASAKRESERIARQAERYRAKLQRARDKKYYADLAQLQRTGLYEPKHSPGEKPTLTTYRKRRINKAMRENKRLLDKDEFFFVPAPAKARTDAKQLNLKTTSKGIFVEREQYTSARISKTPRKRGKYGVKTDYIIDLERRIKQGVNQGKIEDKKILLVSVDEISADKQRLRDMAASYGPLQKGQYLGYIVHAYPDRQGPGYSHNLYGDIDRLLEALERGISGNNNRSRGDYWYVYRTISIERTTVKAWLKASKPHRAARLTVGGKKRKRKKRYGTHKGRG